MTKTGSLPQPDELYGNVFDACRDKVDLPLKTMVVPGALAGIYIGLGDLFATVALAGANDLAFGAGQVLAGIGFFLGLALVVVAGAEPFTDTTLMVGPVAAREIPTGKALQALSVVYVANFMGAIFLAGFVALSGLHQAGKGAVGRAPWILPKRKAPKTLQRRWQAVFLPTCWSASRCGSLMRRPGWSIRSQTCGVVEKSAAVVLLSDVAANLLPATIGNILGAHLSFSPITLPMARRAGPERDRAGRGQVRTSEQRRYQSQKGGEISWPTKLQIRRRQVLPVDGAR